MNKNPKEYWNILKSCKKKSNEQENIPEILKDESVIIEHFQKQGNPSHFNSNFKKEIENQLKNMEEDMMYKAESDSTITYKDIYLNDNFEPTTPFLSDQKNLTLNLNFVG